MKRPLHHLKVSITLATPDDLPEIISVVKDFYRSEHIYGNQLKRRQRFVCTKFIFEEKTAKRQLMKQIKNKKGFFGLARHKNNVVGYVYGYIDGTDYNRPKLKKGWLEAVAVLASYRGQGIGTQLCRALEQWFRKQRCGCIDITHFASNTGAQRLYERLGFIPTVLKLNKRLV